MYKQGSTIYTVHCMTNKEAGMNALLRHTVLILMVWLTAAGVCFGKQVYLKDGGVIDAQSAWRQGNKVYVKVNRDIVADFAANEIDLRRTFPKSASRQVKKVSAVPAEPKKTAVPPPASAAPVPVKTEQKAAVQQKSTSARPAPKPAVPPVPAGAAAPAQKPADPPPPVPAAKVQPPQQPSAQPVKPAVPIMFIILILATCILVIAGYWVVFQKAGVAGWKCLIPFYNMYILMQIAGKPGWWMFLLLIPLVGVAIMLFAMLSLAKRFGKGELYGVGLFFLPMIFFPLLAFGGSEYEG